MGRNINSSIGERRNAAPGTDESTVAPKTTLNSDDAIIVDIFAIQDCRANTAPVSSVETSRDI